MHETLSRKARRRGFTLGVGSDASQRPGSGRNSGLPGRLPHHSIRRMNRRDFTRQAALGALAVPYAERLRPHTWPGYDRAIVLDMLATAGPFNVPNWLDKPLTPAMVENARRSGITAVNSTVSNLGPTPAEGFEGTLRNIAAWHHEFDAHPDVFLPIRSVADIRRAKAERKLGAIFGFQDTTPYWDKIDRVELFHRLGVRIVQLTYNGANLVGDGCLVPEDRGLKPYGREVIAKLNTLGSLVDLSHVGWETTRQAIDASTVPVAATHSGSAALTNVPRNKPDDILRKLANKGGVIGIFMMPFLRAQGQPGKDDFLRHLSHCLNVCGEDHVGIGSDLSITPLDLSPEFRDVHAKFVQARRAAGMAAPGEAEDIFNYVPDFNSPRRMEMVADAMAAAGHSSARIEKVLGGNWMRLLSAVWR